MSEELLVAMDVQKKEEEDKKSKKIALSFPYIKQGWKNSNLTSGNDFICNTDIPFNLLRKE